MKVDANISTDMTKIGRQAAHLASLGYDGLRIAEQLCRIGPDDILGQIKNTDFFVVAPPLN